MKVTVLREAGFGEALLGLSLSYNSDPEKVHEVARKLAHKGDGHNKFLESICVWLDIDAPRYWWSQFDTYRVGVTKQSESTMHTLLDKRLTQQMFEHPISEQIRRRLNEKIDEEDWEIVKWNLPESFLQRRIVCTNYMALQRIIRQRRTHKLAEWQVFCDEVIEQCEYTEFLEETK